MSRIQATERDGGKVSYTYDIDGRIVVRKRQLGKKASLKYSFKDLFGRFHDIVLFLE